MCNSTKYCPALVTILRVNLGYSHKKICEVTGYKPAGVGNILSRRNLSDKKNRSYWDKRDKDKDKTLKEIEQEYINGATTYELGEKYGFHHATISKWMRELGHKRGRSAKHLLGGEKGREAQHNKAIEKINALLEDKCDGKISLVSYGGEISTFRCSVCGHVFNRHRSSHQYKWAINCPRCKQDEIDKRKKANEEVKRKHLEQRAIEYAKDKVCKSCGSVFHSENPNKKFCSDACVKKNKIQKKLARDREKTALKQAAELKKEKTCSVCGTTFHSVYRTKKCCDKCASLHRHCNHKERAKKYGVKYDQSITLDKLIKRDKNVCQICGEICDKADKRYGAHGPLYPSIDHVIAMANGGGHTWDNVQLAHCICNSIKSDNKNTAEIVERCRHSYELEAS